MGPPSSLPYQERSGHHLASRNLNMIDTNTIADNDVNGASLQRQRGIASGRNGSKAIQVVNQRNPCDKSKNREDKGEQLFGCKDTTYVGTWNVRTLYSAGPLDVLLHQLRGVRWSIMGLSEVRWTGSGELDRDDTRLFTREDPTTSTRTELRSS